MTFTTETAALYPHFTKENAREYGRIGGLQPKTKKFKPILSEDEKLRQTTIKQQIKVVNEQVKRARAELNAGECKTCKRCAMKASDRAQLLRALSQLLEDERVLRQIAPPKPVAPERPGRRTLDISATPIPVQVQVQPAAPQPIAVEPATPEPPKPTS